MSKVICPYCNCSECEADWVDVGVGFVQCSPYYCSECGACQIGPYDKKTVLSEKENQYGWYEPGRSHLTSAPTLDGVPIKHELAKELYELGVLDKK